jgi:hypothetical protein
MAGTRFLAPASNDDVGGVASSAPIEPALWRFASPFAAMPPGRRMAYLREYRMHSDALEYRVGADAFDVRSDVTIADASETATQLLRGLIGSLDILASAPDASPTHRDALAGCAFLARQLAGTLAVIGAGVFPG